MRIVLGDISTDSIESLAAHLAGIDTVVSAIGPEAQLAQTRLADAIVLAGGVKRFVPCGFTTIAPPGGVMLIRDEVCLSSIFSFFFSLFSSFSEFVLFCNAWDGPICTVVFDNLPLPSYHLFHQYLPTLPYLSTKIPPSMKPPSQPIF